MHQRAKVLRKTDIEARKTRQDFRTNGHKIVPHQASVHCTEMFILPEIETDVRENRVHENNADEQSAFRDCASCHFYFIPITYTHAMIIFTNNFSLNFLAKTYDLQKNDNNFPRLKHNSAKVFLILLEISMRRLSIKLLSM